MKFSLNDVRIPPMQRLVRISTWLIAGAAFCLISGCVANTSTTFVPVESTQKVSFFGKYWIELDGDKEKQFDHLYIKPYLVDPPTDTSMVYDVPRLIVDSICFVSPCLSAGNGFCLARNKTEFEKLAPYQVWIEDARTVFDGNRYVDIGEWSKPESDLMFHGSHCEVNWIDFPCTDFLREHCSKKEVTVLYYARLLDRRTGKVLDSAVVKMPYLVKVKTRLRSVGDF